MSFFLGEMPAVEELESGVKSDCWCNTVCNFLAGEKTLLWLFSAESVLMLMHIVNACFGND